MDDLLDGSMLSSYDTASFASNEESLLDVEYFIDELLENTSVNNEHQVSCMDRKEQWALRLLRKWSTNNPECISNLLAENNEACIIDFALDSCSLPEDILLKGSFAAVDNLLASFLVGARQNKCGKQYSADSLRQVIMAIQRYLRRHQRFVSLLTDPHFSLLQASIALEAVDRLSNPTCRKSNRPEVLPISDETIDVIWKNNGLGFSDSFVLLETLVFYVGLELGLTSGHSLRNIHLGQNIFFKTTADSDSVITYKTVVKTGSSPPKAIEVDITENPSDERSLNYILRTYLSYRPEVAAKDGPLFLHPSTKFGSSGWYTATPMGKDALSKTLLRITKRAGLSPDSVTSSQLKVAAAFRLASSGHHHQTIKYLTGLNKSQYKINEEEVSKQSSSKRSVDEAEKNGTSNPPVKLTKTFEETTTMSTMLYVPSSTLSTQSTIFSVPVHTMKLYGDILPQKIRVTSVMDEIFLNGSTKLFSPWLRTGSVTSTNAESSKNLTTCGQNLYEGFVIDMIDALCNKMGEKFKFDLTPDGRFGTVEDGQWNGVVGQVHRGEADLGGAPLTVTSIRYEAVDFCHPFYTTTLCILYTKDSHLSPPPFMTVNEALNNSDYKLCSYYGGIYNHITSQNSPLSTKILDKISRGRMFNSLADALDAMRNERNLVLTINKEHGELIIRKQPHKFGFIETNCLPRHYAFATPKGSPLCRKISYNVMQLMEEGKIDELYHKWWHEPSLT